MTTRLGDYMVAYHELSALRGFSSIGRKLTIHLGEVIKLETSVFNSIFHRTVIFTSHSLSNFNL